MRQDSLLFTDGPFIPPLPDPPATSPRPPSTVVDHPLPPPPDGQSPPLFSETLASTATQLYAYDSGSAKTPLCIGVQAPSLDTLTADAFRCELRSFVGEVTANICKSLKEEVHQFFTDVSVAQKPEVAGRHPGRVFHEDIPNSPTSLRQLAARGGAQSSDASAADDGPQQPSTCYQNTKTKTATFAKPTAMAEELVEAEEVDGVTVFAGEVGMVARPSIPLDVCKSVSMPTLNSMTSRGSEAIGNAMTRSSRISVMPEDSHEWAGRHMRRHRDEDDDAGETSMMMGLLQRKRAPQVKRRKARMKAISGDSKEWKTTPTNATTASMKSSVNTPPRDSGGSSSFLSVRSFRGKGVRFGRKSPSDAEVSNDTGEESIPMPTRGSRHVSPEELQKNYRVSTINDGVGTSAPFGSVHVTSSMFSQEDDEGCCDCDERLRARALELVGSNAFDLAAGSLVGLNAVSLGVSADWMARNRTNDVPLGFRIWETGFAFVFAVELIIRLFAHRRYFFLMQGWAWNVMDVIVVSIQVSEEIFTLALFGYEGSSSVPVNFSFLRLLRVLRLVRLVRLVRILRYIRDLRTLVMSIFGSLQSLGWTILLLILIIYVVALFFTQVAWDYLSNVENEADKATIRIHFGSLGDSFLSLFGAITGGVDWTTMVLPLKSISPVLAPVFSLYIAFSVLAMLNVVMGVFVQNAMKTAKEDSDYVTIANVREIFKDANGGFGGIMTWEDFENQLDTPYMKDYFKVIDIDVSEAKGLFKLLDLDESGSLDVEEFVSGCIRLRGVAKALDIAVLIHEVRRMACKFQANAVNIESELAKIRKEVFRKSVAKAANSRHRPGIEDDVKQAECSTASTDTASWVAS